MTSAGDLTHKVHCQKRTGGPDGYGNIVTGAFVTQFTVHAAYRHLRGGESVIASRLEGVHPALITVRRSSRTLQITNDWQLVDARTGTVWAVNDVTHEEDRQWITLLCREGVAS